MASTTITLERLRACIGREVMCAGEPCTVIEVLEEGPTLVLSCQSGNTVVQANQHGEATRRVPRTRTVPVFNADSDQPHPDFLKLNLVL
ncbi:MAG: hypothetical protein HY941_09990 [Gammaproteobacteria bacterium]|nr:hypothetical protein [Gammaproteobacteria bacterium]